VAEVKLGRISRFPTVSSFLALLGTKKALFSCIGIHMIYDRDTYPHYMWLFAIEKG
jgi:hypothetical protein